MINPFKEQKYFDCIKFWPLSTMSTVLSHDLYF